VRVAHVLRKYNPAEWGGTETALQRLFSGIQPRGVESVVFAPDCRITPAMRDPFVEAGCVVKRFHACVPIWGPSRAEKEQLIAVGGNLMSFDLPLLLWRESGVDVVHSHALGRLGGIALTIAKRRRLPFVVTVHGGVLAIPESLRKAFDTPVVRGWEWGRAFGVLFNSRGVLSDADAILTCNEQEARLLREKYPGKRIQVQPHGVPVKQFLGDCRDSALAAFPHLRGKQVLLLPGRIDPVKNQSWVLRRAASILQRHPKAVIVLAGPRTDKAYGEEIDELVKASGFADRILLTGGLPPADPRLIGLFQLAAAVILPSQSETFGLVVLESWAARAPVIASRTPGASALVRHSENGWLFDLEAPAGFDDAIDAALLEPALARKLAAAGHELAASQYDSVVLAGRVQGLYEELTEQKRSRENKAASKTQPETAGARRRLREVAHR